MICRIALLFFFYHVSLSLTAQSLPDEYIISSDGRRLMHGLQPQDGLYDDKIVRRIDLTIDAANWKNILTQNYSSKKDLEAK